MFNIIVWTTDSSQHVRTNMKQPGYQSNQSYSATDTAGIYRHFQQAQQSPDECALCRCLTFRQQQNTQKRPPPPRLNRLSDRCSNRGLLSRSYTCSRAVCACAHIYYTDTLKCSCLHVCLTSNWTPGDSYLNAFPRQWQQVSLWRLSDEYVWIRLTKTGRSES